MKAKYLCGVCEEEFNSQEECLKCESQPIRNSDRIKFELGDLYREEDKDWETGGSSAKYIWSILLGKDGVQKKSHEQFYVMRRYAEYENGRFEDEHHNIRITIPDFLKGYWQHGGVEKILENESVSSLLLKKIVRTIASETISFEDNIETCE